MKILGIETSCDETAAAVVEDGQHLLSNVVASSLALHAKSGGVIPETAAREQLRYILPVIDAALREAGLQSFSGIDALAVTNGPGLIGALMVGVETAKTLAYAFNKPLHPVNHLAGHLFVNYLDVAGRKPAPPLLFLVVSGGHTQLLIQDISGRFLLLGETLDDAAGEAFDKVARLLKLGYPGGPGIEKIALSGDPKRFNLPRPMLNSDNFDFSFSGLKTAVLRLTKENTFKFTETETRDLAAAFQAAVVEVIVAKTVRALRVNNLKTLVAGGGVLANEVLRAALALECQKLGIEFFSPSLSLSTDNAAGIAAAAFFLPNPTPWLTVKAEANLPLAVRESVRYSSVLHQGN